MKGGLPMQKKPPEISASQLLTGKHEELIFIQLPNSLPSHPPTVKQEQNTVQAQTSGHQSQQKAASNAVRYQLFYVDDCMLVISHTLPAV